MKYVIAFVLQVAAQNITQYIATRMTHMQSASAGVGKHIHTEIFFFSFISIRTMQLFFIPDLTPLGLI